MATRPEISTVMLCWNRLALSQRCLASYLDTTSVEHELFLIDNASTDGTRDWMRSLAASPGVTGLVLTERNDPAAALNEALGRCNGRLLHIMENDYVYAAGWDRYVLDRFARLPALGQLGVVPGLPRMRGEHRDGLVYVARDNVCTTSVLRREIFETGIRVRGHYLGNSYPNDYDLSAQIRAAGWLVAWSDVELARHVGIEDEEFRRDPGYYVRDYALKLFSGSRLRGQARRWLRLDFYDTAKLVQRLARALRLRFGPPPGS
jgi:glycosyltransferase involved in cell wall biosynthesis